MSRSLVFPDYMTISLHMHPFHNIITFPISPQISKHPRTLETIAAIQVFFLILFHEKCETMRKNDILPFPCCYMPTRMDNRIAVDIVTKTDIHIFALLYSTCSSPSIFNYSRDARHVPASLSIFSCLSFPINHAFSLHITHMMTKTSTCSSHMRR